MIELPDFSDINVLVVGDVMLDSYWHGGTNRISPEAPVPVVRVTGEEGRPGGAGNVALNITSLCGKANLLGLTGDDDMASTLEQQLQDQGVKCSFKRLDGLPTITKLRIISRHQQLIRLDFEDGFTGFDAADFLSDFDSLLQDADLVVLSDYGKGTLRDVSRFISRAKAAGKPVLVDPKGSDFNKYSAATLITPNLSELEAVVGPCENDEQLVERGLDLMGRLDLEALLVTRGEHGMTLLEKDKPARHLPTHAREVFDVTGAGDTVISVLAAAMATGMPLEAATQLSNVAAGIVVAKLGTATASLDEIRAALAEQQVVHRGVVTEDELVTAMDAAKARGETIVFTNGCFDILHAGHVTYLEQASRLGDRLVVAVNVDETVRQLKGDDRPVNTLERRMTVLAALGCVDWVVPFSEETPERLICDLKPNFLIKGGDNNPDEIPGAECVRNAGGEVKVMSFVDDCSTTATINSIRERS
jgi:D-beta-D-heptose 7-phosphate kinase/D-beta-D-heptose 1-phosphate adenosyltransferase